MASRGVPQRKRAGVAVAQPRCSCRQHQAFFLFVQAVCHISKPAEQSKGKAWAAAVVGAVGQPRRAWRQQKSLFSTVQDCHHLGKPTLQSKALEVVVLRGPSQQGGRGQRGRQLAKSGSSCSCRQHQALLSSAQPWPAAQS